MPKLEETYLCIQSDRQGYALPIENVVRIASGSEARAAGETPTFSLWKTEGGMAVLLQHEGVEFWVLADRIADVISIPFENIYEVPPEILDDTNRYLAGVAYWARHDCLLFVPDAQELLCCAQEQKGGEA